jgi:hypothetical protein
LIDLATHALALLVLGCDEKPLRLQFLGSLQERPVSRRDVTDHPL